MNNASKIDTNWTKIFNKYPILQTIKDEGKYIITAQQIKEFWEPRLMTKHDHSVNRPQIFIDNSLSILPITRGSYIIGAMDLYHDFALSDILLKQSYCQIIIFAILCCHITQCCERNAPINLVVKSFLTH